MWIYDQLALSPQSREWNNPVPISDNLLVSVPADRGFGGLLLIEAKSWLRGGSIKVVDRLGSMGMFRNEEYLLRVIQPGDVNGCIVQYHKSGTVWTMTNADLAEVHDVIVFNGAIWAVSTGTNEIVRLNWDGTTAEIIKLPGEPDAWHVNCLDVWNGKLIASCFGKFEKHRGWKDKEKDNGLIFDVSTQADLWKGLTMPHTPRLLDDGTRVVCNSNEGTVRFLSASGQHRDLSYPGYFTRGFATSEQFHYVGLSERRNSDVPPRQGQTGRIALIERGTLKQLDQIVLPFREIYDILILGPD
jgi:hypothetical protein